jgi:hypothetical protein
LNTESCDCRQVVDYENVERPGDFYFKPVQGIPGETALHIMLPGHTFICVGVKKGAPGGDKVWGWDGDHAHPTLMPSIHCIDHWHGFLTMGRLKSC